MGRRLVNGIGALITLAALLVGIPAALILISGNPIPEDLGALSRPDFGGELLLGTLLPILGWIAWATFAVSVALELPSQLRGLNAPTMPSAMRPQQHLARILVGAVAVMIVGGGAMPANAQPLDAPAPAASEQSIEQAQDTAPAEDEAAPAPEQANLPTITTTQGDSLWSLAEQHLGDGSRFGEIAALNQGTPQADGSALGADGWLNPGWVLQLPADAQIQTPAAAVPGAVTVQAGDTLRGLAQQHLGAEERYSEIAAANGIANPDEIEVGTQLAMPGAEAAAPAADTAHPADTGTPAPAPADAPAPAEAAPPAEAPAVTEPPAAAPAAADAAAPAETAPAPETEAAPLAKSEVEHAPAEAAPTVDDDANDEAELDVDEVFSSSTVGGVGAIMAAGILGLLGVRRLKQRRRRKPGQRIAMPTPELSTVELELRAVGDPMQMDDVDRALRYLAVWAQDTDNTLPRIFALRLAPDEIALYLDEPHDLPAPFTPVTEDRAAWTINPRQLGELERVPSAPYPALVTLGQDASDAHILVDLEHLGALNVIGRDEDTHSAVTALAVELATSRWADDLQVTLVGLAPGLPAALDTGRIRHVDDVDTLLRNLRGQAAATRSALDSLDVETIDQARGLNPDADAWTPEIVILGHELTEDHKRELGELVTQLPRLGVAAVARGHLAGEWTFNLLSNRQAELEMPEGLGAMPLKPQMLSDDEYRRILELIQVAEEPATTAWEPEDAIGDNSEDTDEDHALPLPASWAEGLRGLLAHPGAGPAAAEAGDSETPTHSPEPRGGEEPAGADAQPLDEEATELLTRLQSAPWVRLLGPVELLGAEGDAPRTPQTDALNQAVMRRATELAAYLALHPGASQTEVHAAFWPGKDPSGKTAASTRNKLASQLRKWLGNDPEGAPYFPRVGASGYRLHEAVTTDWSIFQALVGPNPTKASTARLAAALELVKGQPITGVRDRYYGWAEYLRQDAIAAVGDACHELVTRSLADGDLRTARRAAALAREVDPATELYWRDALEAEEKAGDLASAERIAAQLEHQLDDLEDGYEPEPETQAIIDRIREKQLS